MPNNHTRYGGAEIYLIFQDRFNRDGEFLKGRIL